jgi:hypothetical protein
MKLQSVTAAVALVASGLVGATTTLNTAAYSVTYDETTPGFGWITNSSLSGFEWSLQSAVQVQSFAAGTVTASFVLPAFTITANPGYTLSGALTGSLGNVTYFEGGAAASTNMAAGATLTVGANPPVVIPVAALTKNPSSASSGWFAGTASAPIGTVNSLRISGGTLVLTANAGAGSFAAITGQPQNKLKFEFTANPVPEPETYALLLAGLAAISLFARRRQPR